MIIGDKCYINMNDLTLKEILETSEANTYVILDGNLYLVLDI